MKVLIMRALLCALFTTTLLFNSNLAIAAPTVTKEVKAIQQVVHLNKSTLEELMTLKGIGQKKAQAILAYRKKMGDFKSINDLMNVKGIGEKVLKDNMDRLKI
ncbi:ComEA family DNA-binding protein [Colwellia sp. 1_MG-2023]|uniref:ComEA family DNA-binding protein n=1 Tax=unclassified Colwellia TaxID=196834 RepID=UPI001C0A0AC0|nr:MULTISPECIES: ComEA family DNA-binding protein [unclassified Colwellia]MBU2925757.1 ComEA family DNA-binding protein [Colwellia sp. C2M11]MDO6651017.1 ComEA family DNA-binding protein [Colwellia sp. 3_MG-2023]MDO6664052.1 ComEA family DNA-binding protein [Colwellia sp. 2_MG-2023]MDO6688403.1 ComEA family DNA-binding protein [Colwellia sp. 1_MG-2023]